MSLAEIRRRYYVPAKRGMRVRVHRQLGTITGSAGTQLRIRLDGDTRPTHHHPTWRIQYPRWRREEQQHVRDVVTVVVPCISGETRKKRQRRSLEIRCTGQRVNMRNLQPIGRVCGELFTSQRAYRSRANWIERARAVGWRVSPLQPDKTVNAMCPKCCGGTTR